MRGNRVPARESAARSRSGHHSSERQFGRRGGQRRERALSDQSRAQGGKKLSADQATMIITAATDVRDALGCDRP